MKILVTCCLLLAFGTPVVAELVSPKDMWPFADKAGTESSTALHMDSEFFCGWADGYTNLIYGTDVDEQWQTPAQALGPAAGTSSDIVSLGRGGQITLNFSRPIIDGDGADFAIFENSFSDYFLELAWVEVSSDGIHFVRFPNYYGGDTAIGSFGENDPVNIYGLASKYKQGYGHPFDLTELQEAYDAVLAGSDPDFTETFKTELCENFPELDLNNIGYIRLIDIVGDGSAKDSVDRTIYDPYPTSSSAGFDLEAIGAIHQQAETRTAQTLSFNEIPNHKLAAEGIELSATSDSGLPVSFTIQSGPVTLDGNRLTFTGTGTVEIQAAQAGDADFAPASSVLRSFTIATNIQHIYVAPVPDLPTDTVDYPVFAVSSSGLSVSLEIYSGLYGAIVDATEHGLDTGSEAGEIVLRAFQAGDESTAPAEDVFVTLNVLAATDPGTTLTFADWCSASNVTDSATADDDGDRVSNYEEYMSGTNPNASDSKPIAETVLGYDAYGDPVLLLTAQLWNHAQGTLRVSQSSDLLEWTESVPLIREQVEETDYLELQMELPIENSSCFYRLIFEP